MRHQAVEITLLDDCVFSARSASEGGHESLTRIPGATLLGAAACKLYSFLSTRDAWTAFHSGRLRFGDGLPASGTKVGYPVPYCWHHAKGSPPTCGSGSGRLSPERLFNFVHASKIEGVGEGKEIQPKQLRTGYVCLDGQYIRPRHNLRLKTAIDSQTGRAAEAQLFGYDALARDQRFVASIEADDDVGLALFEKIIDTLVGEALLGRSRSAEYGRVQIKRETIERPSDEPRECATSTVWLLSDVALTEKSGAPTLVPSAQALGVKYADIDWSRTFLRSRRYSPWNAARNGYDQERLVLSAGGVIALKSPLDAESAASLSRGVGRYREAGLGRLWINSLLLAGKNPQFAPSAADSSRQEVAKPNHPLIDWIDAQGHGGNQKAELWARELADRYFKQVEQARRAGGVAKDLGFGPSKSQWARVLDAARGGDGRKLFVSLFEGSSAIIKRDSEGWNVEVLEGQKWLSLADWLRKELEFPEEPTYAHFVRHLVHRIRGDLSRRRS
jgi:hypothetical protein